MSNAENFVKIGPVHSEILAEYANYHRYHPKSYNFSPRKLQGYWTESNHISTQCIQIIAT